MVQVLRAVGRRRTGALRRVVGSPRRRRAVDVAGGGARESSVAASTARAGAATARAGAARVASRLAASAGVTACRRGTSGGAPVVLARGEALDLVADLAELAARLALEGAPLEALALEGAGGRVLESLVGAGPFEADGRARSAS